MARIVRRDRREKDRQRLLKLVEKLNKLLEKRKESAGHPSRQCKLRISVLSDSRHILPFDRRLFLNRGSTYTVYIPMEMNNEPEIKLPLDMRCPTCGAAPGENCTLFLGATRSAPHRNRQVM